MMIKKILVPYNFKLRDEKCIHYVLKNFSSEDPILVTLLHIHAPIPEISHFALDKRSLIKGIGRKITDFKQKEDEFLKIKNLFLENDFSEEKVEFLFVPKQYSIAKDIIELVNKHNFTTIILNRSPKKRIATFTESVSMKLITSLKDKEIIILT